MILLFISCFDASAAVEMWRTVLVPINKQPDIANLLQPPPQPGRIPAERDQRQCILDNVGGYGWVERVVVEGVGEGGEEGWVGVVEAVGDVTGSGGGEPALLESFVSLWAAPIDSHFIVQVFDHGDHEFALGLPDAKVWTSRGSIFCWVGHPVSVLNGWPGCNGLSTDE